MGPHVWAHPKGRDPGTDERRNDPSSRYAALCFTGLCFFQTLLVVTFISHCFGAACGNRSERWMAGFFRARGNAEGHGVSTIMDQRFGHSLFLRYRDV